MDSAFVSIIVSAFILSHILPDIIANFVFYSIWFIYYIYVFTTVTATTKSSCNCNYNKIYKLLVICIFGLLIVSNLILFKMDKHDAEFMHGVNTVLFLIGTIIFALFYNDLRENGCTCSNFESIGIINFVNIITVSIKLITLYINA